METAKLKKFAQAARRALQEQVSAKMKLVLAENSAARRESSEAIKKLGEAIKGHGKDQVIERVAYIWFNRFCALRFMDVNRYTRIGVVSPAEGQFQPEILAEAKMGHIDEDMVHDTVRQQIFALLDGKAPARDPQGEAYRLLLVAACNFWNKAMPFLFQRIDDYTELLMPDDLLSGNSILAYTREAMTPDACEDVEVIGWLYQFYIAEKKDEVINRRSVVKKEEIPAATQLFTPKWIVQYMVDNSLGRLWLLNRPGSKLVEQMDYYIKPEQAETDFLRITKPEEIKVCDPACGSGHMLTYAFDLLYAIYEEEGYEPTEIPEKILTNNLYGIEIDERAGELAAFALTMKARARQRRFFNKGVKPNICVLENLSFDEGELRDYMDFIGRDLFTAPLQTTLRQFEEADNFGSLIRPDVTDVDGMLRILESKNVSGHLFISMTHQKVLKALGQADYLSPKYHVVIANPPYMGGKMMNSRLKVFAGQGFKEVSSDLFSMFIIRILELNISGGMIGLVTPYVWMFISSYEQLRQTIFEQAFISSLIQLEYNAFGPATVPVCTFTLSNCKSGDAKGTFIKLSRFKGIENQKPKALFAINNHTCDYRYEVKTTSFADVPGFVVAYWLGDNALNAFISQPSLGEIASAKQGLITGDNNRFLRLWHEVCRSRIGFDLSSRDEAKKSNKRWFPHQKGGNFRKWYGNNEFVVNWQNDGYEIRNFIDEKGKLRSRPQNLEYFFKPAITWTSLTITTFNCRSVGPGYVFDAKGPILSPKRQNDSSLVIGLLNSVVGNYYLNALAPTMDYNQGPVSNVPFKEIELKKASRAQLLIDVEKSDWDSYEASWDFTSLPLLNHDHLQPTLKAAYQKLRTHWREMTLEMQRLEQENNRIFIDAYGLQNELLPEVPLNEITLTCNPHYRYGNDKSEDELEALLLADTMRELVSYAVGCMFGRYAVDKPGLILANQGDTIEDYLKRVPEPSFPADDDNVIPMMEGEWFADNINIRFREFLRVAFGKEHFQENLAFVEKGLGKDIRKYFVKDFYNDHVKRYKKRPIYWLFSSPKGSFNALIYMHRYRPDTVSVVLNDYLREFRTKLTSEKNRLEALSISSGASQGQKTKALKEIEKITKMIVEMEEYEREVLYPLATEQVEIDLDDGVKVNYPKFGPALKKITGLS